MFEESVPLHILKSQYNYQILEESSYKSKKSKDEIKSELSRLKNKENLSEKEEVLTMFMIIIYSLPSFGKMSSLLMLK